ncbi:hypothetical protein LSH36_58g20014 [Paralvinella palmiformis]|uniref:Uncharacterized protein n=1 Tax=Paralvinella palmiformis TaxID=53620 RepID=A0AAD9NDT3_9ANNE|nr:hypothetical protein LSH36_58g20014 [Paralvinella palmiformis]
MSSSELSDQTIKLKRQCDLAKRELEDLNEVLEDMKKACDNEHIRPMQKLRKDVAAKDRQIECLEEQLRRHTNVEIKKLKRGASKVELLKAENRRLQSQISSPSGYVPKVCEQSAITWPTSPSKPSSIAMRLGERLQGNVAASSPSQRLLTRLYGDEIIMKDEVNTPDAVSEDRDEVSTVSWDGSSSSEDDVMSPGCVTEELMSPVGITKDIKKTNDELKYLETKHLNGKEKSICQNGLKSDKEEGADSAKVNGHNPELGQEAEAKKCVQSVKVNGHDPELSGEFSGKKGAVSATVYGHGQELNWESHRDAEGMARYVGGEKKRQSWNLTGNYEWKTTGASH